MFTLYRSVSTMKCYILSLLLAAAVEGVVLPRQAPVTTSGLESVAPHIDPVKISSLPSQVRDGSTRRVLRYGPFTLRASNVGLYNPIPT
jgi:hypothetical protein